MFIATLFITAEIWKKPKCLTVDEWNGWGGEEYYAAIKKNNILPYVTTWMDLEGVMLSAIS